LVNFQQSPQLPLHLYVNRTELFEKAGHRRTLQWVHSWSIDINIGISPLSFVPLSWL
jgi:hypothetical protein